MRFRVCGCYWSKGQFRNREINIFGFFLLQANPADKDHNLTRTRADRLDCRAELLSPSGPEGLGKSPKYH
jgi:hypothetical protein